MRDCWGRSPSTSANLVDILQRFSSHSICKQGTSKRTSGGGNRCVQVVRWMSSVNNHSLKVGIEGFPWFGDHSDCRSAIRNGYKARTRSRISYSPEWPEGIGSKANQQASLRKFGTLSRYNSQILV